MLLAAPMQAAFRTQQCKAFIQEEANSTSFLLRFDCCFERNFDLLLTIGKQVQDLQPARTRLTTVKLCKKDAADEKKLNGSQLGELSCVACTGKLIDASAVRKPFVAQLV